MSSSGSNRSLDAQKRGPFAVGSSDGGSTDWEVQSDAWVGIACGRQASLGTLGSKDVVIVCSTSISRGGGTVGDCIIANIRCGPGKVLSSGVSNFGATFTTCIAGSVKSSTSEDDTSFHAVAMVLGTSSVGGDDAKAELEGVGKGGDALGASWILADHDSLLPVLDIALDPLGNGRFSYEIVDRAPEEALRLSGVEIDGDNVVDTGDMHEVCKHPGGNGTAVAFALGLARIGEVGHDGWTESEGSSRCSVREWHQLWIERSLLCRRRS